ncbi:MAG: SDR family NAD(P)-dependent oxidoreductase, partial [Ilumatobacteraceae bacterium]
MSSAPSTVLITGCSSGFGLLAAVTFARHGHHVVATMRDTARSQPLLDAASAAGVEVDVAELDVSSSTSVDRAISAVVESTGHLD